jgi:hypothetical protein
MKILEVIQHYYLEKRKLRLIISFENIYTSRHVIITRQIQPTFPNKDMITLLTIDLQSKLFSSR